jgi:hypothetical protein
MLQSTPTEDVFDEGEPLRLLGISYPIMAAPEDRI